MTYRVLFAYPESKSGSGCGALYVLLTLDSLQVAFTPNVLLNSVRGSYVMISGLTGGMTPDTPALPLKYSADYAGAWDFVAPMPDLTAVFDATCNSKDKQKKYMRLSAPLNADLSGGFIILTSYKDTSCAADDKIYAKVVKQHDDGCLEIEAPQTPTCFNKLGSVTKISVVQGGSGYKTEAFKVVSGTGTGLNGTCTTDGGKVTGVEITNSGWGYTKDTVIECPSNCNTLQCGSSFTPGKGAIVTISVDDIAFAVAGGQWHSSSGTLKMRVRTALLPAASKLVTFQIRNGYTPQSGLNATILAGGTMRGATPIESKMLQGTDVMHVSKRTTAITTVCESTAGDACDVATAFSQVKTGLRSYSLKVSSCSHAHHLYVLLT